MILCGAGGPLPDPQRSAPCLILIAGDQTYLVDAGAAAATNMAVQQVQPGTLDAVFLTHFHSDHIDGLGQLGVMRWAGGGHTSPLPVYGPDGIGEVVAGLSQTYRLDSVYRAAHHGPEVTPPTGAGLMARSFAEPREGESAVVFEAGALRVTAFRVDHPPIKPAVGYRFDYQGRSVVVSGDTSQSENLERFATGADLLVHEALSPALMNIIGRPRAASETTNATDRGGRPDLPRDARRGRGVCLGRRRGHLSITMWSRPADPGPRVRLSRGGRRGLRRTGHLGRDGTTISLPAGTDDIRVIAD